jgi:hopene-associated glycosyltransferase HpnB
MTSVWWEVAAWIPAAAWIYLLAGRGRYWRTGIRLDPAPAPSRWPAVTVVVPARNEEEMLQLTMPRLLAQRYPGTAEVVLVDDCSTDRTAEVAIEAAAAHPAAISLRVVGGMERPPGWVGKTWALQQGFDAASAARPAPDYILFTDADIDHPPDSLSRLVAAAEAGRYSLVSLMARLRVATRWEKLIVPAFVYFFSQLYPFRLVGRSGSRSAAAAGGCVLVRRQALLDAGGVQAIASAIIDDVALGRAVKRSGGSLWLGLADDVASIRPYPRLSDLWDMVARSAYTQLRYSPLALAGTVAGLLVLYLGAFIVVAAGAATGNGYLLAAGLAAWLLMTVSYLPMVSYYRLNPAWAGTLPLAAAMYGAMTVDSARRHWSGAGAAWKGRTYATGSTGAGDSTGAAAATGPTGAAGATGPVPARLDINE